MNVYDIIYYMDCALANQHIPTVHWAGGQRWQWQFSGTWANRSFLTFHWHLYHCWCPPHPVYSHRNLWPCWNRIELHTNMPGFLFRSKLLHVLRCWRLFSWLHQRALYYYCLFIHRWWCKWCDTDIQLQNYSHPVVVILILALAVSLIIVVVLHFRRRSAKSSETVTYTSGATSSGADNVTINVSFFSIVNHAYIQWYFCVCTVWSVWPCFTQQEEGECI